MAELTLRERANDLRGKIQRVNETIMLIESRLSAEYGAIETMNRQLQTEATKLIPLKSELEKIENELSNASTGGMVDEPSDEDGATDDNGKS